jgi:outer membrane immunogenic protein
LTTRNLSTGVSEDRTSAGWAGGLGVEIALARNWTTRAEYLYVDLNDRPFVLTGANHGIESSLLRIGVNYRF